VINNKMKIVEKISYKGEKELLPIHIFTRYSKSLYKNGTEKYVGKHKMIEFYDLKAINFHHSIKNEYGLFFMKDKVMNDIKEIPKKCYKKEKIDMSDDLCLHIITFNIDEILDNKKNMSDKIFKAITNAINEYETNEDYKEGIMKWSKEITRGMD